jgi:hypothetical protein
MCLEDAQHNAGEREFGAMLETSTGGFCVYLCLRRALVSMAEIIGSLKPGIEVAFRASDLFVCF